MIKVAVVILACILVGFAVGRRLGIKEGFRVGMAYGVLDMRQQCLKSGRCPICNSAAPIVDNTSPQDSPDMCMLTSEDRPSTNASQGKLDALLLQDVTT
ncbi:MAG: hypothetical protein GX977_03910 [Firmicutes bacterium]|nr:hypothetical protein [Bacillota bacterium]